MVIISPPSQIDCCDWKYVTAAVFTRVNINPQHLRAGQKCTVCIPMEIYRNISQLLYLIIVDQILWWAPPLNYIILHSKTLLTQVLCFFFLNSEKPFSITFPYWVELQQQGLIFAWTNLMMKMINITNVWKNLCERARERERERERFFLKNKHFKFPY